MRPLIVIPARFASQRFPGKPLAMLRGAKGQSASLIERSWRAACSVPGCDVIVATDDDRIKTHAESFGARVDMTSSDCANGTERVAETALRMGADLVVNLQGDAPLTPPWFIQELIADMRAHPEAAMATPVLRCNGAALANFLEDRKSGRVGGTTAVFGADRSALYFSKEVIPYTTHGYPADDPTPVWHHVGAYAYRVEALRAYIDWEPGPLEQLEALEQLRFLERGAKVLCTPVDPRGRAFWEVNNPADIPRVESMLAQMGIA